MNAASCHAYRLGAQSARAVRARRAIGDGDWIAARGVAHVFRAGVPVVAGGVVGVDAGAREAVPRRPAPAVREVGRRCAHALARPRALVSRSARQAVVAGRARGDGRVAARGVGAASAPVAGARVAVGVALVAGRLRERRGGARSAHGVSARIREVQRGWVRVRHRRGDARGAVTDSVETTGVGKVGRREAGISICDNCAYAAPQRGVADHLSAAVRSLGSTSRSVLKAG